MTFRKNMRKSLPRIESGLIALILCVFLTAVYAFFGSKGLFTTTDDIFAFSYGHTQFAHSPPARGFFVYWTHHLNVIGVRFAATGDAARFTLCILNTIPSVILCKLISERKAFGRLGGAITYLTSIILMTLNTQHTPPFAYPVYFSIPLIGFLLAGKIASNKNEHNKIIAYLILFVFSTFYESYMFVAPSVYFLAYYLSTRKANCISNKEFFRAFIISSAALLVGRYIPNLLLNLPEYDGTTLDMTVLYPSRIVIWMGTFAQMIIGGTNLGEIGLIANTSTLHSQLTKTCGIIIASFITIFLIKTEKEKQKVEINPVKSINNPKVVIALLSLLVIVAYILPISAVTKYQLWWLSTATNAINNQTGNDYTYASAAMITPFLSTLFVAAILLLKEKLFKNANILKAASIFSLLRICLSFALFISIYSLSTTALSSWNQTYNVTRDQLNAYIELNQRCSNSKQAKIGNNMMSKLSKYTAGQSEKAIVTFCNASHDRGLKVK